MATCRSKANQKDLFSTSHCQMSSHFLENWAPVCIVVASEDKHFTDTCARSSSLLLPFVAEHDILWCGISLWLVWVSYLVYGPLKPLVHHQPMGLWREGWRDNLDAIRALHGSGQNIGVLSTPFLLQIQSTALWWLLPGKSTPPQPDQIQYNSYSCSCTT